MTVEELIDHLASNPQASWDLDRLIAEAIHKPVLDTKRYTSDLPSAITLLPWGWAWMVGCAPGESFFATVQTTEESGMDSMDFSITAKTAALAMALAALTAWKYTRDEAPT